jgi:hypothetical protein
MNEVEAQRERSVGAPWGKLRGAELHKGTRAVVKAAVVQRWVPF